VVIITCPGCKNNHLIADHLGYFDDDSSTIEKLMEAKGQVVTRQIVDANVIDMTEEELVKIKVGKGDGPKEGQ
jgi:protein import protein ZIM17